MKYANGLWDKLSREEKDAIIEEANQLKEDYQYLSLMVERNKKVSNLKFDLVPTPVGGGSNLMRELWRGYYKYDVADVRKMLTDHYVAKKLILSLNDDDAPQFTAADAVEIVDYFKMWEINLRDYIGDFIGCSHSCERVAKDIDELKS